MPGKKFAFYNNLHNNERTLYDWLLAEAVNHYGVPMVYYMVSFDTTYDPIFGEDCNRRYVRKFDIMSYYELPNEDHLWTKFGIEGLDNFHIYISIKHFWAQSTMGIRLGAFDGKMFNRGFDVNSKEADRYDIYASVTPKVGDIIKAKYNDYYYEIINVKREKEQFLQKKHSWDLTCKPYINEQLTASKILSGDDITKYNTNTDIFGVSGTVDQQKINILYQPAGSEENINDPYANW